MTEQSTDTALDDTVGGYTAAALWSTCAHGDYPDAEQADEMLDTFFRPDDLTPETAAEFRADCADFLASNRDDIAEALAAPNGYGLAEYIQIGRDFWLTRNGHSAGFWDRGLGELGDRLADAARVYGSVNLFVTGGVDTVEMVSS